MEKYVKATELRQRQLDLWQRNELDDLFSQLEVHIQSSKERTFVYTKPLSKPAIGVLLTLGYDTMQTFEEINHKRTFKQIEISW